MKKISKEDRDHTLKMYLWADNLKSRIEVLGLENKSMTQQIVRNETMVRLENETLSAALKKHNEWLKSLGLLALTAW